MNAIRFSPCNLTAEQTRQLIDAGCYLPRVDVVAADLCGPLDLASVLLRRWGFSVEHLDSIEPREPMSIRARVVLGVCWLSQEKIERR